CFFSEPDENGNHHTEFMFFMPNEDIDKKEKNSKVPFQKWIDQGFIKATKGSYTDYAEIRNYINDKKDAGYEFEWLGTDPWNATQLMNELDEDGFNVEEFPQT